MHATIHFITFLLHVLYQKCDIIIYIFSCLGMELGMSPQWKNVHCGCFW